MRDSRATFVIVALLAMVFIALIVSTVMRLRYGVDFTDEAFYVALPYTFTLGGRPFVDEHALQQTAAILVMPIIKLRIVAAGNEGLVLFVRRLWLALALITSVFVFIFARRAASPEASIVAAMLPLALVLASIPSLSYNTIGMLVLTIGLSAAGASLLEGRGAIALIVVAVSALGAASFAYPTLIISAVIAYLMLLAGHRKNRIALAALFASAAVVCIVCVGVLQHFGGFAALRESIAYHREMGVQGGGISKLAQIGRDFAQSTLLQWPRVIVVVPAVIGAIALPPHWRPVPISIMAIVVAAFPHKRTDWTAATTIAADAVLLFAVPLLAAIRHLDRPRLAIMVVWVPSVFAGLIASWTSTNGWANAVIGFLSALCVTIAVLGARFAAFAFVALVLSFHLALWSYVYRDDPVAALDTTIDHGAYAGLCTTVQKSDYLRKIERDVQRFADNGAKSCLFYPRFPAGYLLSAMRPDTPTLWIPANRQYSQFDRNHLIEMFRTRKPEVIFEMRSILIRSGNEETHEDYGDDPFQQFFWRRGDRIAAEREAYTVFTPCPGCTTQWLEAESLVGVTRSPDYSDAAQTGWAAYSINFSGGQAAVTRNSGAAMTTSIPFFVPGDYEVDLSFYSYDPNTINQLTVTLGDVSRVFALGPGCRMGLHRVANVRFSDVRSPNLEVRAGIIEQPYVMLDSLAVRRGGTPQAIAASCAMAGPPSLAVVVVEAEDLLGVGRAKDYGAAAAGGWASYEAKSYTAGRAALTRFVGATMRGTIPRFRRGDYRVTIRSYSYGPQSSNEIAVTLGSVTHRLRIGGPAGMIRVPDLLFRGVDSATLMVRATAIGQPYVIVDWIELEPRAEAMASRNSRASPRPTTQHP